MTDASSTVTEALPEASSKRRQIRPKAERRQQLIDATIRCIAQHGLSAVTMQMVTREAGLSVGIANLHFESKDNLLKDNLSPNTDRTVLDEFSLFALDPYESRLRGNGQTHRFSHGVTNSFGFGNFLEKFGNAS